MTISWLPKQALEVLMNQAEMKKAGPQCLRQNLEQLHDVF